MKVFLCGKGLGAFHILANNFAKNLETFVFTTDPALLTVSGQNAIWCTDETVNRIDLWPCEPTLIVSCGYLDIMTPAVLQTVGGRAINCHYALLPNHRGRSPVPWAILDGDAVTGVTWHWIEPTIDTGAIMVQTCIPIKATDTQATLFRTLDLLAAETWEEAAAMAMRHEPGSGYRAKGFSQYHRAGPPYGGVINPNWSDVYVERFIRAMTHPPRKYATFNGVEVKTWAEYVTLRETVHAS